MWIDTARRSGSGDCAAGLHGTADRTAVRKAVRVATMKKGPVKGPSMRFGSGGLLCAVSTIYERVRVK